MTTQAAPSRSATSFLLLAGYLAVLGALVFLPFGRGMDLGDRLNLEPFATIDRALELGPRSLSFRLMLGNIAAFVPLGLLLPLVVRTRWSAVAVLIGAFALSVTIELGQLAVSYWLGFAYRSTDVDDVILNVLGAALGYGAVCALEAFVRERARSIIDGCRAPRRSRPRRPRSHPNRTTSSARPRATTSPATDDSRSASQIRTGT